jgi:hypothetical protein
MNDKTICCIAIGSVSFTATAAYIVKAYLLYIDNALPWSQFVYVVIGASLFSLMGIAVMWSIWTYKPPKPLTLDQYVDDLPWHKGDKKK